MVDAKDILYGRYLLVSKLGNGGMGIVFKAMDQKTNKLCAIKEISLRGMESAEVISCADEIIFLSKLKHENILTCYEHFQKKDYVYIVTEFCKDGDLACLIKNAQKNQSFFPTDIAINYTLQIVNGLNYVHKQGIIHQDIKPHNIFISDAVLKIGDFGIAKKHEFSQWQTKTRKGCYQAPEFMQEETTYGYECDIWSLGVTIFELYSLGLPFKTATEKLSRELNSVDFPHHCPEFMKEIILRMLSKNKNERPSTETILIFLNESFAASKITSARPQARNSMQNNFTCVTHINKAHDNWVLSLVLLSGEYFASASLDNSIRIWNKKDFACVKHIKQAHENWISSLVSLSDESFASGSADNSIKIWNRPDFKCAKHLNQAHDSCIYCIVLLSDKYFASGSADNSIKIWNNNDLTCVKHLKHAHNDYVHCLVLLYYGLFASGSRDNSIKIWNKNDFTCVKHIREAHDSYIYCLVLLSDGRFASGSSDNSIKIWNKHFFSCVKHIKQAHDSWIFSLVSVSDGFFASGSRDNSIKIWNHNDFSCVTHIKEAHDSYIFSLVSLSDESFASGSYDNSIKIWNS